MAALSQSSAHGSGEWTAIRLTGSRMLGASGRDIAALDEASEVGFRAEAVIGRHLVGQAPALTAVASSKGSKGPGRTRSASGDGTR